jgi:hypothetical protein
MEAQGVKQAVPRHLANFIGAEGLFEPANKVSTKSA